MHRSGLQTLAYKHIAVMEDALQVQSKSAALQKSYPLAHAATMQLAESLQLIGRNARLARFEEQE
jgi:hypothetical protein